ncbi:MAG TPA: hypothetical protein VGO00_17655 [Kofleriaceae bacterium]|nr:hypothetical protein [Kofleriaceae bacterium]
MNSEIDGYFIEAGVPRALVLPDVEVERASAGALAAEVLRGFAPLLRPAVVRSRRPVGIETTLGSPSLLQGIRKFGIVIDRQNFDALHSRLADRGAVFVGTVSTDDGLAMRSFLVQDNNGNPVQFFSRIKS